MLVRDRRTIFFSVLLPLIIVPGFIFVMRFTERRAEARLESRAHSYAIAGSHRETARELLLASTRRVDSPTGGGTLVEVHPADPDSALAAGDIHLVVEAFSASEAEARKDSLEAARATERERGEQIDPNMTAGQLVPQPDQAAAPRVPLIELRYRGDSEVSQLAASRLQERLEKLREHRRMEAYRGAGLRVDPDRVAAVELQEVATAQRESGAQLALLLTPILVLLMLSGGSVVAADAISGEKERGTLETLLTTSLRRADIVLAKQALIITVGIAITVINVANVALYLGLGLLELPERFVISIAPLGIVLLLLLFLPVTVLISSALLLVSGYARSYKEFQLYFFPVLVAFLIPSSAAVLPTLELSSVISVVPLANVSVAVREVLMGDYDWPFLVLTLLTTIAVAAWLARLTERSLSVEKLITASELDEADLTGGPTLFPRRVLRWFAVMWAALFLTSAWLSGDLGLRAQVLLNLVGIFLGGSLLMLHRYRLDPKRALALRAPKAAVWPAVLVGAPSAFVVGVGVAHLGQLLFPIPQEVMEAFGEFLLPEAMPLWQTLAFLAVLPAVCEEIAFRGVLLHGLRKRFRPVVLALVVGAIFGFFHVDLFRILPTAYLGVLLTGVTLLTGSIFPAMLWHALNNSVSLVPAHFGWWAADATLPVWAYPVGVLGLAVSLGVIWANRTPYPDLKEPDAVPHGRSVPARHGSR